MKRQLCKSLVFLFLITISAPLAFAQTADQPPTIQQLQQQITELLKQVQFLQQQLSTLKGELGATPAAQPTTEVLSSVIPPELTRNLSRGASGDDVRKLQEFLAGDKKLYPEGLVTGYFGSLTEAAVKRWQARHDIESLGIVGPKTIFKFTEQRSAAVLAIPATPAVPGKIIICHIPPGELTNKQTIEIDQSAQNAHLAHGDTMGECITPVPPAPPPPPTPPIGIAPSSDCTLSPVSLRPPLTSSTYPDLYFPLTLTSVPLPSVGLESQFNMTVENAGPVDSVPTTLQLKNISKETNHATGEIIDTLNTHVLKPKQRVTFLSSLILIPASGLYSFQAVLDPTNQVNEGQVGEANNVSETWHVQVPALSSLSLSSSPSPSLVTPWSMLGNNPQHTGKTSAIGPQKPIIKTEVSIGATHSSPVIGPDGTVYILNGTLDAYNQNGTKKWSACSIFETSKTVPAIGADGTVYVGSYQGLYAFTSQGVRKWTLPVPHNFHFYYPSPVVGPDGTIYIGSYAVNPDGTEKHKPAIYSNRSSALGPDGTLYVDSDVLSYKSGPIERVDFYALNPDGSKKWGPLNLGNGGWVTSPSIDDQGMIYRGTLDKFYAIQPTGVIKWVTQLGGLLSSSATFGPDGVIYVTTSRNTSSYKGGLLLDDAGGDNKLYAFNPDGSIRWKFQAGHWIRSKPAVDANGVIYFTAEDGLLYAVNSSGTLKWTVTIGTIVPGANESSPAITDGKIVVSALNKAKGSMKLYVIGSIEDVTVSPPSIIVPSLTPTPTTATTSTATTTSSSSSGTTLTSSSAAVSVTSTSVTVSWTTNIPALGYATFSKDWTKQYFDPLYGTLSTSHSVTLTGLTPGTTYSYIYSSRTATTTTPFSGVDYGPLNFTTTASATTATTTATTGDTTPPVISNVQVTNITASSVTITWITDENSDSQVEFGISPNYGGFNIRNESVTSHSLTINYLQSGTTYHYRVKSKDAAGNLATSGDYTFTTNSASTSCIGPYHVLASDGRCVWSCGTGTQPDNSSGQCVCQSGYIENGTDQFGRRVCTQTTAADITAPSTPTGLTATTVFTDRVNIGWSMSIDNVGVTGYKIYRNGAYIASVLTASYSPTATEASYSDQGLASGGTYSYTVSAYDAAGNESAQSSPVTGTTQALAAAPAAPTNLTVVSSGGKWVLNWTDNATTETVYAVYFRNLGMTNWNWITTLSANVTTYSDTLMNGTNEFKVYACTNFSRFYSPDDPSQSCAGSNIVSLSSSASSTTESNMASLLKALSSVLQQLQELLGQ